MAITTPEHTVPQSETNFLINDLLPISPSSGAKADILSTDTHGFVKLWRFSTSSNSPCTLELVGQHKLFDHAIICRTLTAGGKWLLAGGKEGGREENVCGLDGRLRALKLDSLGGEGKTEVKELGEPSLVIYDMKCVGKGEGERLVVSLMRKGRAWLEVWDVRGL